VVDVRMPGISGLELQEELLRRGREVLKAIVAGKPNKIIADELGISVRTVEAHRARVMDKTGTATVAELIQTAIDAGATRRDAIPD
jgi:FixJ family two-component response regulator